MGSSKESLISMACGGFSLQFCYLYSLLTLSLDPSIRAPRIPRSSRGSGFSLEFRVQGCLALHGSLQRLLLVV